ncbi:MAG: hypothetical protein L3J89_04015 [Gammaproteobacteria bacterium]|nr:hypothetical protein [Gammaproteobacteria bacterium]
MLQSDKTQRLRQRLAVEAARIMSEESLSGFQAAKQKAANRLGITGEQSMPRNIEIEQALKEYQAIFRPQQQANELLALRKTAIQIMNLLHDFSPRLVGPVLRGSANHHSAINIHLFTDNSQTLEWLLIERHIPFNVEEHEYRFNDGEIKRYPCYRVEDEEARVELAVFPEKGIRQAPKGPLDGKPIQRASISEVQQLLQQR